MATPPRDARTAAEADRRRIFASHPMFSGIAPAELDALLAHARLERRPGGDTIFRKGDPALNMVAVLKGQVKIATPSPEGRDVLLNIIKAGEVFGEIAMLDGKARTADAIALSACELLVLDRRDVLPFLEKHPELCLRLMMVLCDRLRHTSAQVEDFMFLDLEARLAKALLRLAETHGTPTRNGVAIGLKLSQRELGAIAGISREGINRQLREWQHRGVLGEGDGPLLIRDVAALTQIAEG